MVVLTGQLFLRPHEVDAAVSAALDGNIQVTSLVIAAPVLETPTYSMFITADAPTEPLASGVRRMVDAIAQSKPTATPPPVRGGTISRAALDEVFAPMVGQTDDGTYTVSVGREVAMPCACTIGVEMGVASVATFTGSDDRAAVAGQIACSFGETQRVLKALRAGGLSVTGLYDHLDGEAPRLLFVHFSGIGKSQDLAKSVRAAMETPSRKSPAGDTGHEHHH
jgi:hypothetical protein